MQVAMAAPDQAGLAACQQQRTDAGERGAAALRQAGGVVGRKQVGLLAPSDLVLIEKPRQRLDPGLGLYGWRLLVRGRHHPAEPVGEFAIDTAALGDTIERLVLVEAQHLDRPLDRLTLSVERETAIGLARDRNDAAVNVRREGAVHLELGRACRLTFLQRGVIEKGKAHRTLDLEGVIAGEKHRRGVRIEALDVAPAMGRGVAQEVENRGLVGGSLLRHREAVYLIFGSFAQARGDQGEGQPSGDRVMPKLPHELKRIRLNLARSKEFPAGSAQRGYEFVAPLDADCHIDARLWRQY